MRLAVVAVGRLKAGPERDLVDRYAKRAADAGRALGFSGPDLVELPESRARRAPDRSAEEALALLARVGEASLVAFDERGQSPTSEAFAERLASWRDAGRAGAAFVIGGADGLDASVREKAQILVSFGRLTLPHQIVRGLVLEQIYRAMTILGQHPYHRGGA